MTAETLFLILSLCSLLIGPNNGPLPTPQDTFDTDPMLSGLVSSQGDDLLMYLNDPNMLGDPGFFQDDPESPLQDFVCPSPQSIFS